MTPNELAAHINEQASVVIRSVSGNAVQRFRRRTPANRTRTRRALTAKVNGLKSKVGLRFSKQYPSRGTETQQRFEQQWQNIRPLVRQELINRFNQLLKGS